MFAVDRLKDVSMKRNFDTLRQQQRRASWVGPTVGSIHGTFEASTERFQPHYHLIAPAEAREAFQTLRSMYPTTATGSAGVLIKPVGNLAGALSYSLKGFWSERVPYRNALEQPRHQKRRLRPAQELEWLTWQASHALASLLFLQGVRRYGQTLRRHPSTCDGRR